MHDKLGNLDEAVTYYHRARLSLSSLTVPKDERGMLSQTNPNPIPNPYPNPNPNPNANANPSPSPSPSPNP